MGLDEIEANEAAEKIRKYTEPLGGKYEDRLLAPFMLKTR